ncbi:MAG: Rieske 2Fe-2S domain-containing protein [DPANN group archaeon]|nr:Rieske 2Fe-2S domain-containing protein [DPANN group archaeon]
MAEINIGKADLKPGQKRLASANGKKLLVANVAGKYYCMDGLCTHVGGPLWDGMLDKNIITCPWHKCLRSPPKQDEKSYNVKQKGNELFIEI